MISSKYHHPLNKIHHNLFHILLGEENITTFCKLTPVLLTIYLQSFVQIKQPFNRRMPNFTTVVQTASDLFEREIRLNSPKKLHFSALYSTIKPSKIFRHCSVNSLKLIGTTPAETKFHHIFDLAAGCKFEELRNIVA